MIDLIGKKVLSDEIWYKIIRLERDYYVAEGSHGEGCKVIVLTKFFDKEKLDKLFEKENNNG